MTVTESAPNGMQVTEDPFLTTEDRLRRALTAIVALQDEVSQVRATLQEKVTELEAELLQERRNAERRAGELADFKERVHEVGQEYAERHEWCSVYDEIMEDLGLPPRARAFTISVRCHYAQAVSVMATSEEDAEEQIANADHVRGWRAPSMIEGVTLSDTPYALEFEVDN